MTCRTEQLPGGLVLTGESFDETPVVRRRRPRTTDERLAAQRASEKRLRDKRRGRRSVARRGRTERRTRNGRHSMKRIRTWQALRRCKRRPPILQKDRHQVKDLVEALSWKDVYPVHLRDFLGLRREHRELLGWVVLMCCIRGALAVEGSRKDWARLLDCCARTAWTYLEDLVELNWLEKLEDFLPSESTGRDGERLKHRQLANLYRPGPLLREAWERHEQTYSDGKFKNSSGTPSGSPRGNFCHPSGRALPTAKDPIAPFGIDSKVSASPTADPPPPSGARESASPTEVGEPTLGRQADSTEIKFRATDGDFAAAAAPALLVAPESPAAAVDADVAGAAAAEAGGSLEPQRPLNTRRAPRGKRSGQRATRQRSASELPRPVFVSALEVVAAAGAAPPGALEPLEQTEREERQREAQRLLALEAARANAAVLAEGRPRPAIPPPSEAELAELEAFALDRRQLRWLREFYLASPENRDMALRLARCSGESRGVPREKS